MTQVPESKPPKSAWKRKAAWAAFAAATAAVLFAQNRTLQQRPVAPQPAPVPYAQNAPLPQPERLVVPAGTTVRVRLDQSIGTRFSRPGDRFSATLETPLIADGQTAVPAGARVTGIIREAKPSGRLKGRAVLILALDSVDAHGRRLPISTTSWARESNRHRKRNLLWMGGGGGTGSLIGAIAGGPVGLGIGLGAGTAAGLGGAIITGKMQVRVPAETTLNFRLSRSLTV
jgi:hypothetical protein